MKNFIQKIINQFDMRDWFIFGGMALIAAGLRQAYPPAAFIVPGAMLFWLGIRRIK